MMRYAIIAGWLLVATLFIALRFDNTERVYFLGDDNLVLYLVDDIVKTGNWQPDWYRASNGQHQSEYFQQEGQRTDLPHQHHYNFASQILLGAGVVNAARAMGNETASITLLHHLAFFLDALSLLCVIGCAKRIHHIMQASSITKTSSTLLALCAAFTYTVFPLAVQGSHYARPDALLTCTGSVLLWLCLNVIHCKQWQWLLATAATLALAITAKSSQIMMGIYPAIALLHAGLSQYGSHQWQLWLKLLVQGSVLIAFIMAMLATVFMSANISFSDFVISTQAVMQYYAAPAPPEILEHYTYFRQLGNIVHYFYATLGSPLCIALLLGAACLLKQRHLFILSLLCVPLLFFIAYFASVPAFFDRSFCPAAAAISLLAAIGIRELITLISNTIPVLITAPLLTALFNVQPIVINYHLQTDHLREHRNEDRLAFQKALLKQWPTFWIKNVDRADLFSRSFPVKPPKNSRIYVVEDFNDWNSGVYAQQLRDNYFVQIAEFEGDFHDVPTSSLLTVHEAARFRYFIRQEEITTMH
jgi:hypothetical protein